MSLVKPKSVSVIGLGRVGLLTLFHLARRGFRASGFDINRELLRGLKNKVQPFREPEFDDLLNRYHKKIKFVIYPPQSRYYFVCVPTPFHNRGWGMDLSFLRSALGEIKKTSVKKYVFIRSTLSPGTCQKLASEFKHLSLCYFPEFFREGCFVRDYKKAGLSVFGSQDIRSFQKFSRFQFSQDTVFCSLEEAEILKIACNLFHGLKISFANEVGRLAENFKASPHKIMEIFLRDKNLNVSEKYLKPGFSYGGPCLSKDICSIESLQDIQKPRWLLPRAVEKSNRLHSQWVCEQILKLKPKTIGILGCSFTGNPTYDCRQSPVLSLVERLSKRKGLSLYGLEEPLNQYRCSVLSEKSINQFVEYDMCILGGWNSFLKPSLFLNYKGILFDLLIQNLPKYIKNHPNYKTAFS